MLSLNILLVISFNLQLAGIGIFGFLIWFILLRKYRSLGLRVFFLFSIVSVLDCCWLYSDIQDEKSMEQNGHLLTATVLEKNKVKSEVGSTVTNQLTISFQFPSGKTQTIHTSTYISDYEFNALTIGQRIAVLHNPANEQTYYTVSFNRYKKDQWIFYVLPIFFFVMGLILGIICRKYEVGIHEDTGDEYVEKDGKIIFDEKDNAIVRVTKHANSMSKLFQAFK